MLIARSVAKITPHLDAHNFLLQLKQEARRKNLGKLFAQIVFSLFFLGGGGLRPVSFA